jgi:bifunctional non-homologous end joining protein LigD
MSLDEYKRKRRFEETPEPPAKVEKQSKHRFVVQRHRATRLHYDFRLEMDGVLKSWAVPKGPSLDPGDKRLAMQVEDHPVSYFDFEGTIPEGNYGAGSVMVWDVGTWEPLSAVPVDGKYVRGTDAEAEAMLAKGDLKFRLKGKRLNGDFALVHIKARRPGSKGNEWLLIKKKDDYAEAGFDIDKYDKSVLTNRTMVQIGGDEESAEWTSSRPAGRGKVKAAWLADAIARADKKKASSKKKALTAERAEEVESAERNKKQQSLRSNALATKTKAKTNPRAADSARQSAAISPARKSSANSESAAVDDLTGAVRKPMPSAIESMLATPVEKPFDSPDWLFEIKWDGYRATAFIDDGQVRLVSRNQNNLSKQFTELAALPNFVNARRAILDGEIVALDEEGRPSFSLMQQRTGFRPGNVRGARREGVAVLYYAFDLLYLDDFDLRRVALEQRKQLLRERLTDSEIVRFSDHVAEKGLLLFQAAKEKGLEGIVGKRRASGYEGTRSRDWLKVKITQRQECVIGGYTDPEGSREHLGSLVLGLYEGKQRLIHVGQVGSGFNQRTLKDVFAMLQPLATGKNPFYGEIGGLRRVHFVRPKLVAEIKFSEWTHETGEGGPKLRAPVFLGLRADKEPDECTLEDAGAK